MSRRRNSVLWVVIAWLSPVLLCASLMRISPATGGTAFGEQQPEAGPSSPDQTAPPLEERVLKLLDAKCARCHGETQRKADLNLSTSAGVAKGSESGAVIVAGKPDESLLYEMVHEKLMPPEGEGSLTAEEVEAIRQWIADGAKLPQAVAAAVSQHDVVPLMYLRCTVCHGLRRQEGSLDLRSKAGMLKGGKSGPAIVPGKPEESLLLKRIHAGEMPPRREVVAVSIKPMEPPEVELLGRWIAAGAPEVADAPDEAGLYVTEEDRKFWAFRPLAGLTESGSIRVTEPGSISIAKSGSIPEVRSTGSVANPIDAFVLAKLEAQGLGFSPAADKPTLIRRAWFDLLGLPPTPAEAEQVLADDAAGWYERMLDRLLASPHYGERWGRYWLDLAGYSDSQGFQDADIIRPEAYRYRDYVIRSFNADKPYDRFLLEQIAGDELADYEAAEVITDELYDNLVATGFLRLCADGTHANITNFVPNRLEFIAHEIEVLSSAVMGLTIKCARCHSHKFDPIPHQDYYRLLAVFKGALDEHDWMNPQADRYLPHVTTKERTAWEAHEQRVQAEIDAANAALDKSRQELTTKYVEERLAKLPAELQDQLRKLLTVPKDEQTKEQQELFAKYEKELRIDEEELKRIDAGYRKLAEETAERVKSLEGERRPEPRIRALWDRGEPSPTYILKRGNYLTPGRPVEPGPPSVLADDNAPYEPVVLDHTSKKTGRRLAFARWLTRPGHPLTSRVMVNRIWEHHFGTGLVATTDNFGKTGAAPTHPELLDWLAATFIERGWSMKAMHRLMMTSTTYRQSSRVLPVHEELDPANRLLSRMPVRRLEAEALRDSLIYVAGRLDPAQFGPADPVDVRGDGLVTARGRDGRWRRSVYVLQRRTTILTLLENFDLPGMTPNCIERRPSTVAPQALHLLNNGFVNELAGYFAERVRSDAGDDPARQLEHAWRLALGRPPDDQELQAAGEAFERLTKQWAAETRDAETARVRALTNICRALLNSAAFVYVD